MNLTDQLLTDLNLEAFEHEEDAECGHPTYVIKRRYNVREAWTSKLCCMPECDTETAAIAHVVILLDCVDEGSISPTGEVEWEDAANEKVEDEAETEVFCDDCLASSTEGDWVDEDSVVEELESSEALTVTCRACLRSMKLT